MTINNNALFNLSYGLFVLSSVDAGCIINTAMQITSSPNTIAISVNKQNNTHDVIKRSGKFNLSVLSEKATFDIIKHFGFQSSRDVDKFISFDGKSLAENDIFYITEGTNAYFCCKVINEMDCGTHTMFLAEIVEADVLSSDPSATYSYYHKHIKPQPRAQKAEEKEADEKKWVCRICGYVYEGEELPDDFICPICKHPANDFEQVASAKS